MALFPSAVHIRSPNAMCLALKSPKSSTLGVMLYALLTADRMELHACGEWYDGDRYTTPTIVDEFVLWRMPSHMRSYSSGVVDGRNGAD